MFKELDMVPTALLEMLTDAFNQDIPFNISSVEDLTQIGTMLAETTNQYSYLASLLSYAKLDCRDWKRMGKEYKQQYEDAVDRREIIQNITDAVKLKYNALSRLITIKQEIDAELKMSDVRY